MQTPFARYLLPASGFWLLVLLLVGRMLQAPAPTAEPKPVDARLIELPAPRPARPVGSVHATPAPPVAPHPLPPVPHMNAPVKAAPPPVPSPPAPPPATPPAVTPPRPSPPTPAPAPADTAGGSPGAEGMGARAVYQPTPDIPEALRQSSLHCVMSVQFAIGTDGRADVTLRHGCSDPRINQVVLTTLQTWRFFPAMQNNQPVASTLDMDIPIDINP